VARVERSRFTPGAVTLARLPLSAQTRQRQRGRESPPSPESAGEPWLSVVRLGAIEGWLISATRRGTATRSTCMSMPSTSVGQQPAYHALSSRTPCRCRSAEWCASACASAAASGAFVYQCRILAREDAGMMAVVEVTRTRRGPSKRTQRPLRAMRHTMSSGSLLTARPIAKRRLPTCSPRSSGAMSARTSSSC
jgi:hypothetical protein